MNRPRIERDSRCFCWWCCCCWRSVPADFIRDGGWQCCWRCWRVLVVVVAISSDVMDDASGWWWWWWWECDSEVGISIAILIPLIWYLIYRIKCLLRGGRVRKGDGDRRRRGLDTVLRRSGWYCIFLPAISQHFSSSRHFAIFRKIWRERTRFLLHHSLPPPATRDRVKSHRYHHIIIWYDRQ
jgi:hypothetical protein